MKSHPNYPSLISFTDTLDELGLAYSAVIAEKDRYTELQYPLLAYCSIDHVEDFVLVPSSNSFADEGKSLLNSWSGHAVIVAENQIIIHKEHDDYVRSEANSNRGMLFFSSCLGIILFSLLLYNLKVKTVVLFLESLCGVFICSLIILQAMGKENVLTEQFCSSKGRHGCNKVLQSKANRFSRFFGLGDVGLMYFSGLAFYLSLSSLFLKQTYVQSLLLIPASISVLFTVFSLFYQWKIIKSWCRLCLFIVFIIWIQSITLIINRPLELSISIDNVLIFVFLFLIPALIWIIVKPIVIKVDELDRVRIDLAKWKRRPDLFLASLKNQRRVNVTPWENEIILGNPNAPINITVAANLFCWPCSRAHDVLEELLVKNPDLVVLNLRFIVNPNEENESRSIALEYLLETLFSLSELQKRDAILKWFELMDLEKFKNIYPLKDGIMDWYSVINNHYQWAVNCKINLTPTIFLNGYQLPSHYLVDDLKLLVPQFIEVFESNLESKRA
jgi:hypothetical protein